MNYVLIVTGVPGVGKSVIGGTIAAELGCAFIESSKVAEELGLARQDPTGRYTRVLAPQAPLRITESLVKLLEKRCVVLATVYPEILVDKLDPYLASIILLRVHPLELERRLKRRAWPERKIIENLVAEATNYYHEALAGYESCTLEVDVTHREPDVNVSNVLELLSKWSTGFRIDWLLDEKVVEALSRWLNRLYPNEDRLPQ